MRRILLLATTLSLLASSVSASGFDLSALACPGNSGISDDAGTLDCATGSVVELIVTFQPAEDIADFDRFDVLLYGQVAGGDLSSTASFWGPGSGWFQSGAFGVAAAPRDGMASCGGYTRALDGVSGGVAGAVNVTGATTFRIDALGYRETPMSLTANQKVLAMVLRFDSAVHIPAESPLPGCSLPVCFSLQQLTPRHSDNTPGTILKTSAQFGTLVSINGSGGQVECALVPVRRQTWGQLKQLYR